MTYEEAAQCTARLLTRAMGNMTATELGRRTSMGPKQIGRFSRGILVPRLHVLNALLRACGYELTVSMRKVKDDDDS